MPKSDYTHISTIGKGSFGIVHKVRRNADGKVCVRKVVDLSVFKTDKARKQALDEAKIMQTICSPHIVQCFDTFIEDTVEKDKKKSYLHIVLEFCDRGDLKRYLAKRKALPERSIWRIFLHTALGLQYLHQKRIMHRDIKSENIFLVGSDDFVRIGDLGLARELGTFQSAASTLVGTPRYLSPEEVKHSGHYNDKCDVWSLGVILYELCSEGHKGPFDQANTFPVLIRLIAETDPDALPSRVPDGLKEICKLVLEKDCFRRPNIAKLLTNQTVVKNAAIHGVSIDDSDSGVRPERSRSAGSATNECVKLSPQPAPNALRGRAMSDSAVVPDGFWSRLSIRLGLNTGEVERGPRFKRLDRCEICQCNFSMFRRRHHCRQCGSTICGAHTACTSPQRICMTCSPNNA